MQKTMEVELDVTDCNLALKVISCTAFRQISLTSLSPSSHVIRFMPLKGVIISLIYIYGRVLLFIS